MSVVTPIEYVYVYEYGDGDEHPKLDPGEGTVKANVSAGVRGSANIVLLFCIQFRP